MAENALLRLILAFAQAHETLRNLWGREYGLRIQPHRQSIKCAMQRFGCGALEAPMRIREQAKADGIDIEEMALTALMAAAMDELERRPCAGRA